MADLIFIVFWHPYALGILSVPLGYRKNISENWREQSCVLDYAHTLPDSFFADTKTIPDKASVDP